MDCIDARVVFKGRNWVESRGLGMGYSDGVGVLLFLLFLCSLFCSLFYFLLTVKALNFAWDLFCKFRVWVIPCQLIHFFANPSPILMKFGKLGGQQKKQIHTKFQLISTIFNGVRAL